MITAWSSTREIKFRALEGNLFSIQCFCLGDWLKVTKEGPWLFRQNAVAIEPYDGLSSPDSVDLNFIDVWLQIHKLPDGYRSESLVKNLVEKKIGKVSEVETSLQGIGNFVRARVKIDVRKALVRFVSISRGGQREFYKFQFEKFPKFCGACGLLGHTHIECGTGEHDESKLKLGDFLKADRETWHGRRGFMGGRGESSGGRRSGRESSGRVRGRGDWVDWRSHPEQNSKGGNGSLADSELKDTATSPIKSGDITMTDININAKRRLEFGNSEQPPPTDVGNSATLMIMDGQPGNLEEGLDDLKDDNNLRGMENAKRQKSDSENSNTNSRSAGSFEGCRREQ